MKIQYDDNIDGFIVPVLRYGAYEEKHYRDDRGRQRVKAGRKPATLIFMKFLREEDYNDFCSQQNPYDDGDCPTQAITSLEHLDQILEAQAMELGGWVEETYVPELTKRQLSPQDILDYKENINARNIKRPVPPDDPMVNGNGLDIAGRIFNAEQLAQAAEAMGNEVQHNPIWQPEPNYRFIGGRVNGQEEAQAQMEVPDPGVEERPEANAVGFRFNLEHIQPGNWGAAEIPGHIYYRRGDGEGAVDPGVVADFRPAGNPPVIVPANDPNLALPAEDRPVRDGW